MGADRRKGERRSPDGAGCFFHRAAEGGPVRTGGDRRAGAPVSPPAEPDVDVKGGPRIYPCDDCGTMRSKAEGGTVFTVCEECWDKRFRKAAPPAEQPPNLQTAWARLETLSRLASGAIMRPPDPTDPGAFRMYVTKRDAEALAKAADALYRIAHPESSPPVAPEGWRPIETAPKDGTVVVGWFVSTRPNWSVLPPSADVMYWTDHNGGGWVRHAHGEPIYWHALPPTPPGAARPHAGDER